MKDIKLIKADTCSPDETIHDIAKKMAKKRLRRFFVVDKSKKLIGIVTTVDIINEVVSKHKEPSKVKVKDIMEKKVRYIDVNDSLDDALKIMNKLNTFVCPITKNKKLLGIVSYQNIISSVTKSMRN